LNNITIAVDAMGGDHGPTVIVPAVLQALDNHASLKLILVGDSEILQQHLQAHQKKNSFDETRLVIKHSTQLVAMDESPSTALRSKKDSSMRVAINLVKDGTAHACVSAGNTGALMATARFVLKTVDSTAEHLLQFAVMGSVLASAVDNIPTPKVYLLNIGSEEIKGNEQVKQAAQLLGNLSQLNYVGFIEGNELYKGEADVVVCDGFVGNVALKTTEGVAVFIGTLIKRAFYQNTFTKLAGMIAKPVLKMLIRWINPDHYNGASLIGLKGIVIKSHGGANSHAFANAIAQAMLQVEKNIPSRISAEVERLLKKSSFFSSWKK
jgi:glycerol-3-phosphate acyltransferase PlsX